MTASQWSYNWHKAPNMRRRQNAMAQGRRAPKYRRVTYLQCGACVALHCLRTGAITDPLCHMVLSSHAVSRPVERTKRRRLVSPPAERETRGSCQVMCRHGQFAIHEVLG